MRTIVGLRRIESAVILDDLHVGGPELRPHKTHPILTVDTDAVLPGPFPLQRLQLVGERPPEVIQLAGGIEQFKLAPRNLP